VLKAVIKAHFFRKTSTVVPFMMAHNSDVKGASNSLAHNKSIAILDAATKGKYGIIAVCCVSMIHHKPKSASMDKELITADVIV